MIVSGKKIAEEIKREVKKEVFELKEKGIFPTLAVVFAGENEASRIFVKVKKKACEEAGIRFKLFKFSQPQEKEILDFIKNLNSNKNIHGILVQLP
ncbi:MAG: tetrahydrofolate dehydrogenase/cyclohydrolase catalytic domain-containing protein, partial [Candidatus Methanofastidiosia archaeon]